MAPAKCALPARLADLFEVEIAARQLPLDLTLLEGARHVVIEVMSNV